MTKRTKFAICACAILMQWFMPARHGVMMRAAPALVSRWLSLQESDANCNLIPPASRMFPSTIGSIGSAAAAPGHVVTLRLDACAPASASFDPVAANNAVSITFQPPMGSNTTYNLATLPAGVCKDGCANGGAPCSGAGDCSGCVQGCLETVDPTQCAGAGSTPPCQVLNFAMPDANTLEALNVAGPARITVTTPAGLVADIGPLFRSLNLRDVQKGACPKKVHPFRKFTVLPRLNTFQNLSNGVVRATVDGDNNLLIPFDYRGIYGARGCCTGIGQLITGHFGFEAFTGGGTPIHVPSEAYVRTYTTDGFDLAPIVKISAADGYFGTADGNEGIIRIARTAGACAAPGTDSGQPCTLDGDCSSTVCNRPGDIFNVTDRLNGGTGPVMLNQVTTSTGDAFPVESVQSSAGTVAVARQGDNHVITWDVASGTRQDIGLSASMAGPKPALQVTDNVVAFLQPETQPGGDFEPDGDFLDTRLRVFKKGGGGTFTELTAGMTIPADAARVVNGESLSIANDRVYYRRPEWADALGTTARVNVANDGTQAAAETFYGDTFAISADGSKVAFTSTDPNLVSGGSNAYAHIYVRDRLEHTTTRVNLAHNGALANNASGNPALSADARYVAFYSAATNLVPTVISPVTENIYLRDTDAATTELISVNGNGDSANAQSLTPIISSDGRFVAFKSLATNLTADVDTNGAADVFVRDRCQSNGTLVPGCNPRTILASVRYDGSPSAGLTPGSAYLAMSADGRFVAFNSPDPSIVAGGTNGQDHIAVRDLQLGTTVLASVSSDGTQANGYSAGMALSADGRFVTFESYAALVAGDTNGTGDIYLRDRDLDGNGIFDETEPGRTATTRVSVASDGTQGNNESRVSSISGDGRYVSFDSFASNLVPGDGNGNDDLFVHDTVTGITMRVNVSAAAGGEANGTDLGITNKVALDGRSVAYTSNASNLVSNDSNGWWDTFVAGPFARTEPFVCGNAVIDPFEQCDPPFTTAACGFCGPTCQCNDLNVDGDIGDTMFQLLDANAPSPAPVTIGTMRNDMLAGAAGDYAAFTNESSQAVIYNAATATSCTLPGTATRGTASATLAAGTVLESTVGFDLDGDGDLNDTVLAVVTAGAVCSPFAPGFPPRGYAADAVAATDLCAGGDNDGRPCASDADCAAGGGVCRGIVVFARPEAQENAGGNLCRPAPGTCVGGPLHGAVCTLDADCISPAGTCSGGCDLNGDGDANDRVLHIYRQSDGTVTNTGQAVEEFVVKDNLVAFRTSEAAQNENLNGLSGDQDKSDFVMQVYDLAAPANSALINTGQAAELCHIVGCDPNLPYKIKDGTVSFLVSETEQNQDLNGRDGIGQEVMMVFDVHSGPNQVFDLPDATVNVPMFPDKFAGGSVLYTQTTEAQLGYDVNGDGDMNDVIVGVSGDADEDGTFDQLDTCVGITDPEHADTDLDGLGDACDPDPYCGDFTPPAPPTPPNADAIDCRKAIGKAARVYLTKRSIATRKCLDRIAAGQLSGDPATLCRGRISGGVEVLPNDTGTALAIAKAAAKLATTVSKGCTSGPLTQLSSCGQTVEDEVRCLIRGSTSTAVAVSQLAYGTVGTIANDAAAACQKKLGTAGVKYAAAVVKAIQKCLDKLALGRISGDPRSVCLGSLSSGNVLSPVNPPSDLPTSSALENAETKLRKAIASKCSAGQLSALNACGSDPTSVGRCLVCSGWRQAFEAVRNGYGPQY